MFVIKKEKMFAIAAMQAGSEVIELNSESNSLKASFWPPTGKDDKPAVSIHHTALKLEEEKKKEEDEEKKDADRQKEKKEEDENPNEEPLVYDVCQIGTLGKFLGSDGTYPVFVTVSFYTNEVRCWGL